ncbi:MAG: lysoplasmalogenase [Deltaproteobacteria bacterium]|nr:lysoplasmalogenase [Deltaproteobacteria bacterium]
MSILSLTAFLLLAGLNWVAVARADKPLEQLVKPAALAALLLYAGAGAGPSGWLIAALVLSLLGDVYLMLPGDCFKAGLSAFLLAHVAYIADFEISPAARIGWLIVVAVLSAPLTLRITRAVAQPSLRAAVVLYIAVIALMVASAFASGRPLAALGALLFFASDGIIAWNRFVHPLAWAQPTIMVTYHLGQLGLVAVLRAG